MQIVRRSFQHHSMKRNQLQSGISDAKLSTAMKRQVVLLLAMLSAAATAHADLVGVSPNGLYTADVHFGANAGLTITGPEGTEDFWSQMLFGMDGGAQLPLVNDFGQVVGY